MGQNFGFRGVEPLPCPNRLKCLNKDALNITWDSQNRMLMKMVPIKARHGSLIRIDSEFDPTKHVVDVARLISLKVPDIQGRIKRPKIFI